MPKRKRKQTTAEKAEKNQGNAKKRTAPEQPLKT
jgi:hypothetical protein